MPPAGSTVTQWFPDNIAAYGWASRLVCGGPGLSGQKIELAETGDVSRGLLASAGSAGEGDRLDVAVFEISNEPPLTFLLPEVTLENP